MFLGRFDHTLDAKGRLFIPSDFKDEINKFLYIMRGYDGCITVWCEEDFKTKYEKLQALPFNQSDSRDFVRLNYASIVKLELDDQGRILLPKKVILKHQLTKKVTLIGVGDFFEIWDTDAYDAYEEAREASFDERAERLPI